MLTFVTTVWAQGTGGAPGPGSGPGGMLISFFPFVLIFIVFYFLLILPQQRRKKKHGAMLGALKKGDRILTSGGMLGTVAGINKNIVTIQVSDNVRIKILKEYVSELQSGEEDGS